MQKFYLALLFLLFLPGLANAKLNVFTCEPEWKALIDEIGGDKITSFSATNAWQDPHYMRAKPSLIAKLRKSDLVICSGADLEVGWLPVLLQKAANAKVNPGTSGYLLAARYAKLIDKPEQLDRSQGDIHTDGNPHFHLNPYNILSIATEIKNRLINIDQANQDYYQNNYQNFSKKFYDSLKIWETQKDNFKTLKLISHHKNFDYLADWLGFEIVANLEAKPGISPSSSHLEELIKITNSEDISALIITDFDNDKYAKWLNKKTNIPIIILPFTIGGSNNVSNLFDLFAKNIEILNDTRSRAN